MKKLVLVLFLGVSAASAYCLSYDTLCQQREQETAYQKEQREAMEQMQKMQEEQLQMQRQMEFRQRQAIEEQQRQMQEQEQRMRHMQFMQQMQNGYGLLIISQRQGKGELTNPARIKLI